MADVLSDTGAFSQTLADRYQVISDVIHNLNTVLATVDQKSAQFNESIDQLQKLVSGLAQGRDPIAGAIPPLASAASDLTDMLQNSRRPIQGVLENLRPLATEMDNRKAEINKVIEPLAENYLRLNSLGAYGAYFNILHLRELKIKARQPGPCTGVTFGSDIFLPTVARRTRRRAGVRTMDRTQSVRTGIFGIVLVVACGDGRIRLQQPAVLSTRQAV